MEIKEVFSKKQKFKFLKLLKSTKANELRFEGIKRETDRQTDRETERARESSRERSI